MKVTTNKQSFSPFDLIIRIESDEDLKNIKYLANNISGWGNGSVELGKQIRSVLENIK